MTISDVNSTSKTPIEQVKLVNGRSLLYKHEKFRSHFENESELIEVDKFIKSDSKLEGALFQLEKIHDGIE